MKRPNLVLCLESLKAGRQILVDKFIQEDPRLYQAMFQHEASPSSMQIAQRKFFFEWLTSHPTQFEKLQALYLANGATKEECTTDFIESYKSLIKSYISSSHANGAAQSEALLSLIEEYVQGLNSLLEISAESQNRLEQLRYQNQKSAVIFDRMLKQLQESDSGLV